MYSRLKHRTATCPFSMQMAATAAVAAAIQAAAATLTTKTTSRQRRTCEGAKVEVEVGGAGGAVA